jgi:pimeloyl-ACP methyl ester carboxylesterase
MRLGSRLVLLPALLLALVAAGLVAPASAAPASAAPASAAPASATPAERGPRVITRGVVFDLINTSQALLRCPSDNEPYRVRGRLVGPARDVLGRGGPMRVNVLVHDVGTGGWFWNLRRHPRYDYATHLARQGETTLVLDRLGYDASPLADGNATCLDAQAHMLHQVVQHLRSGRYDFTKGRRPTPHASHVVVQGHGVGGAIAQLEAARFDDTDGLVLMSWAGTNVSDLALRQAQQQSRVCLQGRDYAPYGASAAQYRTLLFTTAPAAVQRTAVRLRNATPCGDVTSLGSVVLSSALTAGSVEVPVLLLSGSRDARMRNQPAQAAATFAASEKVTTRILAGAGSSLPLERSAPRTRSLVLQWLRTL